MPLTEIKVTPKLTDDDKHKCAVIDCKLTSDEKSQICFEDVYIISAWFCPPHTMTFTHHPEFFLRLVFQHMIYGISEYDINKAMEK